MYSTDARDWSPPGTPAYPLWNCGRCDGELVEANTARVCETCGSRYDPDTGAYLGGSGRPRDHEGPAAGEVLAEPAAAAPRPAAADRLAGVLAPPGPDADTLVALARAIEAEASWQQPRGAVLTDLAAQLHILAAQVRAPDRATAGWPPHPADLSADTPLAGYTDPQQAAHLAEDVVAAAHSPDVDTYWSTVTAGRLQALICAAAHRTPVGTLATVRDWAERDDGAAEPITILTRALDAEHPLLGRLHQIATAAPRVRAMFTGIVVAGVAGVLATPQSAAPPPVTPAPTTAP